MGRGDDEDADGWIFVQWGELRGAEEGVSGRGILFMFGLRFGVEHDVAMLASEAISSSSQVIILQAFVQDAKHLM